MKTEQKLKTKFKPITKYVNINDNNDIIVNVYGAVITTSATVRDHSDHTQTQCQLPTDLQVK